MQQEFLTSKLLSQKNGILAIMGSDDIVRKAMAMADKEVSHQRRRRSAKDDKG